MQQGTGKGIDKVRGMKMELTHDHFTVIYKILSALEANMDTGQPIDTKLWKRSGSGHIRTKICCIS